MTDNRFQENRNQLYWVSDNIIASDFPKLESALRDPDGLLAIGGDLTPERLISAYQQGIFPWYNKGQPIMWWSPDPRCVLELNDLKVSRSLHKTLKKGHYQVTLNKAFTEVIRGCAGPRNDSEETWITRDIITAYMQLHEMGYAHSVECWLDERLVGGLYGIALGKVFFGESMFSRENDASKVALVCLARFLLKENFRIIDCQIYSNHLGSLGAKPMPRPLFASLLEHYCVGQANPHWPSMILSHE